MKFAIQCSKSGNKLIEFLAKKSTYPTSEITPMYNDYLKVLLNPMWVDSQSFCMSGKQRIKLTESLANWGSLCYTINGLKGMFNEET